MKRYKYQTLVTLSPRHDGGPLPALPGPTCRMVVRAHHRETHAAKMFSALVTSDENSPMAGNAAIRATVIVLGDDAIDYLAPGERFELWRGDDLGSGVVTRRIFV
jgi:hypothetical protein